MRREDGGRICIAPQFQVLAPRKRTDLRGGVVELIEKLIDGVGGERHSDDADEHGLYW
jgi:hypothetical protein